MRRPVLIIACALSLFAAAPARAEAAGVAAAAKAAPMSLWPRSGLRDGGRHYAIKGQRVLVAGTLRPYVAGQAVAVTVSRSGRRSKLRAGVRKVGRDGRFLVAFTARRSGRYVVRARGAATEDRGAITARPLAVRSIVPRVRRGSSGLEVRLMQRGLARLGYVTPRSGRFDAGTGRALIAFRKVNGMARRPAASRAVLGKLFRGSGGFPLRYPKAGKHVEFDWSRQVLVLARRGRAERIYHSSSGTIVTPTVFGSYSFYRKQPGTNAKGMVHSNYFIRGYAIHGYKSVPNYPASHGCLRVPIPNALSIYRWIELGDRISVYR